MVKEKPVASLSLDLDNQWTYMKVHGDPGWEEFPSYLDRFVPHVLKVLDDLDLKITFFVVGKDATLEENREYLQELVRRGHEVENHSFLHSSWLYSYRKEELEEEIKKAEEAIEEVTGVRARGFRGPGFSWNPALLEVLQERGYIYDATTFPTFLGPVARWYYFWKSDFNKEEREKRKGLYGSFQDGLRPINPFIWNLNNGGQLLEIPVTTIPLLKAPFHLTYLMFLDNISPVIQRSYFNMGLNACRLYGIEPSYLLHPLDLIGGDQVPELKFFPGMNVSSDRKVEVFQHTMEKMRKHFELVPMGQQAALAKASKLSSRMVDYPKSLLPQD